MIEQFSIVTAPSFKFVHLCQGFSTQGNMDIQSTQRTQVHLICLSSLICTRGLTFGLRLKHSAPLVLIILIFLIEKEDMLRETSISAYLQDLSSHVLWNET